MELQINNIEDIDDDHNEDQRNDDMEASSCILTDSSLNTSRPNVSKKLGHNLTVSSLPFLESKKRRDGLVQERIISVSIKLISYISYVNIKMYLKKFL